MLTTIFRSVLRQAQRHPLYIGINIFGLALGICVFLTLILLVRFDYSYNANFSNADRIVRIDETWHEPGTTPYESADTTYRSIPFLVEDFPQIEEAVPLLSTTLRVLRDGDYTTMKGNMTDSGFFHIFSLAFLKGNGYDALNRPDAIVISRATAITLFGTVDALGKTVSIILDGVKSNHVVTGVLATISGPGLLDNTEFLLPIPQQMKNTRRCFVFWGSSCSQIFLKLHHTEDIATLRAGLHDFVERRAAGNASDSTSLGPHPSNIFELSATPLREMRFHDTVVEDTTDGVDQNVVNSIGLVGLLALLLACANTLNLTTARSAMRAKEVALRKTLGASKQALFTQFMGEALFISIVAGCIGIALSEAFVPAVASMTGEAFRVDYGFALWVLPIIVLTCGAACGVYPALVLSGYRPAVILAATRMPSGGRKAALLRNTLVTGQFFIAVCIVSCTLVIDHQTSFLRSSNRGYIKSGLLIGQQMRTADISLQRRMIDALRTLPGVTSAAFGELKPDPPSQTRDTSTYDSPSGAVKVHLLKDTVSPGYLETYRPQLLAGRWFDITYGQDDSPLSATGSSAPRNIILNERAAQAFGFTTPADAIGKIIHDKMPLKIIGVISNIRFTSPRETIPPEILYFSSLKNTSFEDPIPAVRFNGVTRSVMEERLDQAWRSILPDIAGHFSPVDELMENYYVGDERRGRLFTTGAITALLIACLGLYGLAAFATTRRIHEIGIRKTLGATSFQVITLLLYDFLKPVLLACVLACPVAWLVMQHWLSAFDERITLNATYFLIATGGAVIIATLTVLGQTFRLAFAEPSRALKVE